MINLTKESVSVAMRVANLSVNEENAFFQNLDASGVFTKDELEDFRIVVAYFKLQMCPERTNRIKQAMAEELYREFNQKGERQ